ncbi:unknown [Clostridium sp. CAG:492]|jgi:hypothetical protein|nr:unknown [Clostridium sp. CAG:492]
MENLEFLNEYYTKKFINIHKYITAEYNEILTKLGITIENKDYSNSEFDKINSKLIRMRKNIDFLNSKNINNIKFMELLDLFDKIEADYDL